MYDTVNSIVTAVNGVVWGWPMIILLLGTHVFLTLRTGFIQRFTITRGIRLSVAKDPDAEGEVSQFGALTTALAATIGTGNIVGVGTAIAIGGPGAVLWCWLTGVFGIARHGIRIFRGVCVLWYRMRDAGECDRGDLRDEFPYTEDRDRRCGRRAHSLRYLWRDQVHCQSM